MIRELEERAAGAWPALETASLDGWVARFAEGYTRRASSVWPLHEGTGPVGEKVDECERLYAGRGQRCIFKLTPLDGELDGLLERRGYTREAESLVQVAELDGLALAPEAGAEAVGAERATERWLDDFVRLNGVPERHVAAMRRVLEAIVPARRFELLEVDGGTAAMGLAVADRGWVGLYDVVTAPARRGQGHATRLLRHLLGWAAEEAGATRAYLQVMADNAPALGLYRKLGFSEAYRYWYRVGPTRPG
jgi:ribosomal protein S18 acetylase RimI-like enzyme